MPVDRCVWTKSHQGSRTGGAKRWSLHVSVCLVCLVFPLLAVIATASGTAGASQVSSSWRVQVQNTAAFWSVSCPSASQCWAGGDGGIMATRDGGASWVNEPMPQALNVVKGVTCPTTAECIAVGDNSYVRSDAAIAATTDAGSTWSMESSPSGAGYLRSVTCPTAAVCLAVGGPSYFVSGAGTIVATDNGGATWMLITPSGAPGLYGISCIPGLGTCIAVGSVTSGGGVDTNGVAYRTTNAGGSWSAVSLPAGTPGLYGVTCRSVDDCIAVGGGSVVNKAAVLVSSDGGQSWAAATLPSGLPALYGISCQAGASGGLCVAGGGNFYHPSTGGGAVITSDDGGHLWSTVMSGRFLQVTGLSCPGTTECQAVTHAPNANGSIMGTSSAGARWTSEVTVSPGLDEISCPASTTCVAVGGDDVAMTNNAGLSWTAQPLPVMSSLDGISCTTSDACDISGANAAGSGGILVSNDGGITWTTAALPAGLPPLVGVSCVGSKVCVAVGGDVTVSTEDGGASWTKGSLPTGVQDLAGISCVGSGVSVLCVAVGYGNNGSYFPQIVVSSNGSTWRSAVAPSGIAQLEAVSCPTMSTCVAVGDNSSGDAAVAYSTSGGVSWSLGQVPGNPDVNVGPLSSVSCSSGSSCQAVGGVVYGIGARVVATSDGGSAWTTSGIMGSVSALSGISCSGICFAVGSTVTVVTSTDGVVDGAGIEMLPPPPPPPSITGVSPASGEAYGGNGVTIEGTSFVPGETSVMFGSTASPSVQVSRSGTSLVAVAPAANPGTVDVTVNTPFGRSASASYTYDSVPTYDPGSTPGTYVALTPYRIADTRAASGEPYAGEELPPGGVLDVQVAGTTPADGSGIPSSGVSAAVLNVTVTGTTEAGYLTAWPTGYARATSSNLNWKAGETVANLVEVPVGSGGQVSFYNSAGSTNLVVDVEGYVASGESGPAGLFVPLSPYRIADTRPDSGEPYSGDVLGTGATLSIQVGGISPAGGGEGVPLTGVAAVVLMVSAVNPTHGGYLTVWPGGDEARPLASNLNFTTGHTVANRVMVPVSQSGQISVFNPFGQTNVVVDVAGWFTAASSSATSGAMGYIPISPTRICDTRPGNPSGLTGAEAQCNGHTLGPGGTLSVKVAGVGGLPSSGVTAIVCNVTVTGTTDGSYLTAWPGGGVPPLSSDLSWHPGSTLADLVVVPVSSTGSVELYNYAGSVNVIIDLEGYY